MRDFDRPTELIVELAKAVVAEMRASYPEWREAFIRMQASEGFFEIKCSVVLPSGVQILDVLGHKLFVSHAQRLGIELRETLPHSNGPFCAALLRVGPDLNYGMQYEYRDATRWQISKLKGGTGKPAGYTAA